MEEPISTTSKRTGCVCVWGGDLGLEASQAS